mmetsp:Transcript_92185/g.192756  ORF Transcript_92185/g.192756 Transcript_92185/m.192756 type:complete len:749 (+) Transcript_92185:39-2285(+)
MGQNSDAWAMENPSTTTADKDGDIVGKADAGGRERVTIQLPKSIEPGVTEVEVDISDTTKLQVKVPEQARPEDKLVLSPRPQGEWAIRILRGASAASAEADEKWVPREMTIIVPENCQAGKTRLSVDVGGGEKLVVTAPESARPGDELIFTETSPEEWNCKLKQSSSSKKIDANGKAKAPLPCEVKCAVPPNVTPGTTKLRIAVGDASVLAKVPEGVEAGDVLSVVVQTDGSTVAKRVPDPKEKDKTVLSADGSSNMATAHKITMTRISSNADTLFDRLVQEARLGGAFVSEKIKRGCAPPLNIPGMVAIDHIKADEELVRVPPLMFFSTERCSQLDPELLKAISMLDTKVRGRQVETFHAVALTKLLHEEEARHINGDFLGEFEGPWRPTNDKEKEAITRRIWSRYAVGLLAENFDSHPYWQYMSNQQEFVAGLAPSAESEYMGAMAGDVIAMYECIKKYVPESLLGPKFELGTFLQARLTILSRVFQGTAGSCMVPINDCFNHTGDPGVIWSWDDTTGDMVMTAISDHSPGEELLISYGRRSNVLLYRTYGFTLPVEMEPDWTFFSRGSGTSDDPFTKYLPADLSTFCVHLEAKLVQGSLLKVLNQCQNKKEGAPEDFLEELCRKSLKRYEEQDNLQKAVDALRKAREVQPTSHDWWQYCENLEVGNISEINALRVKMSEYLCLVAHLEIVQVFKGLKEEEQCLALAAPVRKVLLDGFRILKTGACFDLNTNDVEIGTLTTSDLIN